MAKKNSSYFYKAYTISSSTDVDGVIECTVIDEGKVLTRVTVYNGSVQDAESMAEAFVDRRPDVGEYEA